jgi:hypothetical protein
MPANINNSRAGAVNAVLTGLFNSFGESGKWNGLEAAPFIDVDSLGGTYSRQGDSDELNLKLNPGALKAIADNAPSKQVGLLDETGTVALEYDSYSTIAPLSRIIAAQRANQDYDARAMRRVYAHVHNRHEYKVYRELYSTSGNFTTTSDPGNFLTTPTLSLVSIVQAAKADVEALINASVTHAVCNPDVANALSVMTQVMGWNGRNFNNAATPATHDGLRQFFREMFGLKLIIASVTYTNASGTRAFMMGDHLAIVRIANDGSPSFANTFGNHWLSDVGGPMTLAGIDDVESFDPKGTKYISQALYKVQSDSADAGCLLTDVLT